MHTSIEHDVDAMLASKPDLLPVADVAEIVHRCRKQVLRWIKAGKLTAVSPAGGAKLVTKASLRDLLLGTPR